MGMPAAEQRVTTIEELLGLPDDGIRHELLDGEHVVTPAPAYPHQALLRELFMQLHDAVKERDDYEVLWSPADIILGPRTLVQPDLFVIGRDPANPPRQWQDVGVPVIAIEVLSPITASRDRGAKRRIYQEAGVQEYWIVDLDARLVERWRPNDERPEVIGGLLNWELLGGVAGTIDLPELFARLER